MGWIRCVRCEKLQRDFVGWTFVLTGPVQYVLHQVSYSYETIPNAPKYYETDRNISLESNRVDWVRLLRKIPTWHHGTNFYINCTSSPRFASSFLQLRNDPKQIQTLWNAPKHEFRVQWNGLSAFFAKKLQCDFVAQTFALALVHPVLHRVSCSYKTIPNPPKHYDTHQNMN